MASATATAAAADDSQSGISRREFLYYIWGASIALVTAELTGLTIWFLIPRFRAGQFGGQFLINPDTLPAINQEPVANNDGRFWLVNLDSNQPNELMYQAEGDPEGGIVGVAAIYKVCTHLGCIYDWNDASERFRCPCHGSKYRLDGRRIESPAPRTLDRFRVIALDADGNVLAQSEREDFNGDGEMYGALVVPEGTVTLAVDTGDKVDGIAQTLLQEFGY